MKSNTKAKSLNNIWAYQMILLTLIVLILLFLPSCAKEPHKDLIWEMTFGGSLDDIGEAILETTDGGFYFAGTTWSYGAGRSDGWVIRFDSKNEKIWEKTFGDKDSDRIYHIKKTEGNGLILLGETRSYGNNGWDIWVFRINSDGQEIWSKTFGGPYNDLGYDIQETTDGNYLIAGSTWSDEGENLDAWLIKIDPDGNELWNVIYEKPELEKPLDIQSLSDGGYLTAGISWTVGGFFGEERKYPNLTVSKIGPGGNEIWTKTYHDLHLFVKVSVHKITNDEFILVSNTSNKTTTGVNYYIVLTKIDSSGKVIWNRIIGNEFEDIIYYDSQIFDDHLVIWGKDSIIRNVDYLILKADLEGNEIWRKIIDKNWEHERIGSVDQTSDGNFLMLGNTVEANSTEDYDVWLIKVRGD